MKRGPGPIGHPGAERLAGIDLMRGFGAFGVICVHAGIVVENRHSPSAGALQAWFDFVVPFFLITAFFFALRGEISRFVAWGDWLRQRSARLLVPYLVWSAIYLVLHVLKLGLSHDSEGIRSLFQDPVGLLLDGGTGLALYFLPLLFAGLVVVHTFRTFLTSAPLGVLGIGLLGTVGLMMVMNTTENGYDLGTARGFREAFPGLNAFPPTRIVLVLLADAVRCLPLIVTAAILVRVLAVSKKSGSAWALGLGLVALALPLFLAPGIATVYLPEFVGGAGAFLVGWGLPFPAGKIATTVGAYSFGVYLVHQVILEAMQVAVQKAKIELPPLTILGVLAVGLIAYIISMAIVAVADSCGPFARRLFALR
jgi:peptidoglycan/LPS O-acetylase OafA/YrhL